MFPKSSVFSWLRDHLIPKLHHAGQTGRDHTFPPGRDLCGDSIFTQLARITEETKRYHLPHEGSGENLFSCLFQLL